MMWVWQWAGFSKLERFFGSLCNELDTGSKGFRNPMALGCTVPSEARVLLRARRSLNLLEPDRRGV